MNGKSTSRQDCTISLDDGRRLSYALWGNPNGAPVILLHGWPGSRLFGHLVEEPVRDQDVRLIVPDRPGFGRSDPDPGRHVLDFASDISCLADALDLSRFSVVGYSGGSPYALACASELPDRVSRVAIVSGIAPLHRKQSRKDLPPHLSFLFSLIERVPSAGRFPADLLALGVKHFPHAIAMQARITSGSADRTILLRKRVFELIREEYLEAFRQGGAHMATEAHLYTRPWGFPLEALSPPIRMFHGMEDRFIPVAMARRLAASLPNCSCRLLSHAGHFWIVDHFAEVLADLLDS